VSDPIKTGQPVPLWYEVVAEFSDGNEPIVEQWNGKEFADRAAKELKELTPADGEDYTVTVTVTPMYTPRKG